MQSADQHKINFEFREKLPTAEKLRASHFFGERARVLKGMELWQKGDLVSFGGLMKESCDSSIRNFQTGSEELIELQRILLETPGVFGARFSGAGFGGCSVALVAAEEAERMGLVNFVVEDEELMVRALELADRLAAGPILAISASKSAVNKYIRMVSNVVLPLSLKLEEWTMSTQDFREAVIAFVEKRKPEFTGR